MESESLNLFSDDGTNVQLPSINESDGIIENSTSKEEVDNAISGEIVKQVLISEESDFITPNYLIDLSSVEEVVEIQMIALKSLVHTDGDTCIYLALEKDTVRLGNGIGDVLDRIIVSAVENVFGEECGVYRNYTPTGKNVRMTGTTIGHLRMSI